MKVHLHGGGTKNPVPYHLLYVCPAGHLPKDCPDSNWWDLTQEKPKPRDFVVEFFNGEAEVPDPLGKCMIDNKMALKSRFDAPEFRVLFRAGPSTK